MHIPKLPTTDQRAASQRTGVRVYGTECLPNELQRAIAAAQPSAAAAKFNHEAFKDRTSV